MDAPVEPEVRDPTTIAARLLELARRMPHLIGVTDGDGDVVWLNEAGRRFIGARAGARLTTADLFTDEVFDRYRSTIRPAIARTGRWSGELPVKRADGTTGTVEAVLLGDVDGPDRTRWLACLAVDVSARHDREAWLSHRASHDPLTGLPNRVLLHDRLQVAVSVAARVGSPVAVLAVDLDGFKAVNDRLGHAAGDQLLQQVTARIQAAVRPADTVARIGGDEFIVIVHPPEEPAAARAVAERVRDQIGLVDYVLGASRVRVTASVGLTLSEPGADVSHDALLRAADRGLYRAKRSGGNCIRVAAVGDAGPIGPLEGIGEALGRALADGRIVAVFDPVIDLGTGELCAVHALARWDDPERGRVPAHEFAEEAVLTGYADRVWWAATRHAVRAAASAGLAVPVHVNLSTSQLRDRELAEHLVELRRLAPTVGIHLKVDAHSLLELATTSGELLDVLHRLGLELVLAGHGEHNLPSPILAALPVSAIQLAHGLVGDARQRAKAVALATREPAALDVPCIARVEREADLPLLAVLGVTSVSGRVAGPEWDAARLAAEAAEAATRPRP